MNTCKYKSTRKKEKVSPGLLKTQFLVQKDHINIEQQRHLKTQTKSHYPFYDKIRRLELVTKVRVGIEVIVSAGLIICIDERDVGLARGVVNDLVATSNGAVKVAHGLVEVGAVRGLVESFIVVVVSETNLASLGLLHVVVVVVEAR